MKSTLLPSIDRNASVSFLLTFHSNTFGSRPNTFDIDRRHAENRSIRALSTMNSRIQPPTRYSPIRSQKPLNRSKEFRIINLLGSTKYNQGRSSKPHTRPNIHITTHRMTLAAKASHLEPPRAAVAATIGKNSYFAPACLHPSTTIFLSWKVGQNFPYPG